MSLQSDGMEDHVSNFDVIYNITKVNLMGRKLRVVGLADPDYAYQLTLKNCSDGSIDFNSGFALDLLLLLQYSLNFTYVALKGEGWSDLLPNGSWAGVGRQVLSNEAEFSIAQATLLPWNVKVFDFLFPTSKGFLVAAFRQPPSNSVRNILTASFPPVLWLVLFIFALIFIISIKVLHFGKTFYNERVCSVIKSVDINEEEEEEEEEGWMDALLALDASYWVLVTFCQRNSVGSPESIPMRIIYLALTILCIVAYVVFSAALVSNLSVELLPIRTFTDLIQSQLRIYGDVSIPFTHDYVKNIVNERLTGEGKSLLPSLDDTYFVNVQNGVRKVIDRKSTYISFEDALNTAYKIDFKMGDDYICNNLFKLTVPGVRMNGGMMFRKGSGLRQIFNPKVAMLYERGFIKRFTTIWYGSLFPRCLGDVVHAPPPLNLQDVSTAFMILLLGLLLCSVIFCGERAWLYFLLLYDWNHVWNNYSYPCRNCNVLRNKKHVRSSPDLFR
ncbi:uncharacterized protein LOC110849266 [Folsomia candida]|uniref:Glutamate receptor n=1 Tax=Folsomia candida TaxID=158441 RepID=A0A226ED33_FOLCA|nr:uncharacterized protein LOC110849266 [Folsomia candida]OXA55455.1 Glutamate receptor [Folsomia candida]